jgi:hypothetical protein
MWVRRSTTTGLMARFSSHWHAAGQWRRWVLQFGRRWTNVAALRARSHGMRAAVRSRRGLLDLPLLVMSKIRYQTRSLFAGFYLCTVHDYGRHWLLEASWKRSAPTKSPKRPPQSALREPRHLLHLHPALYPTHYPTQFEAHFHFISISSSCPD